jgi:branched-chain amino acid transport system ATP-binding protein
VAARQRTTEVPFSEGKAALIEAKELEAGYHGNAVLHGVSLVVKPGQVVALLGANGAGKSTTLLALSGDLRPLSGRVLMNGAPAIGGLARRARKDGLAYITEQRSIFPLLSAKDNLRVGLPDVEPALEIFPELRPLLKRRAGLLSGGEQQMLIVARALARRPRIVLADEVSLGLAPMVTVRLHAALRDAADHRGCGVLMVEQHVRQALKVADWVYVMRAGEIVLSGTSTQIASQVDELESSYLTPS